MTARTKGSLHPEARHARSPFTCRYNAVTIDVWYTLLYHRREDRHAYERDRREVWVSALTDEGVRRGRALAAVLALERKCRREESRGRSFPIPSQVGWLASVAGRSPKLETVLRGLDLLTDRNPARVAPGAAEALGRLSSAGVRLGLVSNVLFETTVDAERILERSGLRPFFSELVFSSDYPWTKPSPEPFRVCLEGLHAGPGESVHIGDLSYDVTGARKAGMDAILFTGLRHEAPRRKLPPPPRGIHPTAKLDAWGRIGRWIAVGDDGANGGT